MMGFMLLVSVYAWETGGYGFIELEISNSTASTVFPQPLKEATGADLYLSIYLSRSLSLYIYIYLYVCVYIYIYIYNNNNIDILIDK